MSKIKTLRMARHTMVTLSKKTKQDFGEVKTDKGELYYDGDGELEEGMDVYMWSEEGDGSWIIPADGDYVTETRVVTVEGGVAVKIVDKDGSGSGEGGNETQEDMSKKYVSREEYNQLLDVVNTLVSGFAEVKPAVAETKKTVEKMAKTSVQKSANEDSNIQDRSNMSDGERMGSLMTRGK